MTEESNIPTPEQTGVAVPGTDQDALETRLYEVGFHVVPLVGEDGLATEITSIRQAIESNGGTVVSEEFPQLIDLAYPMQQTIARARHTFERAYFGSIKFEASGEASIKIKNVLDANEHILRYIIIKTIPEETPFRPVTDGEEEKQEEKKPKAEQESTVVAEDATPKSTSTVETPEPPTEEVKKEIDKEIDKLIEE